MCIIYIYINVSTTLHYMVISHLDITYKYSYNSSYRQFIKYNIMHNANIVNYTGWWFGTCFSHSVGNVIIPTGLSYHRLSPAYSHIG